MLQMLGQEMRKGRLSLDEAAVATAYLDAVLAGVVMDMDATISASHGGSGAGWFSLATVPADGAAAGDYELTAYGFSFSGAPGDPGSYWLSDGDSYFQLAGANPAFLDEMHKSTGGHDWWIAMAFRLPDAGGTHALWSTQSGTTATGHRLAVNSARQPNYIQRGDTANSQTGNLAAFTPDTDTLAIFSRSHAAGQIRYWINTTTAATVSHSYNGTATGATAPLIVGAGNAAGARMPAGSRIYALAAGNTYLDDAGAAIIAAHWEERHARTYL